MFQVDDTTDPARPDREDRLSPDANTSARRYTGAVLAVLGVTALVVRAEMLEMSPLQAVLTILGVGAIIALIVGIVCMFYRLLP